MNRKNPVRREPPERCIRPITPARAFMKPVCLLLALVLLFMSAFTYFVYNSLPNLPLVQTTASLTPSSSFFQSAKFSLAKNEQKLFHFLLIGQDRQFDEAAGRSDAMLLCSFHKGTNTFSVTSFLRDLYVSIPGHGFDRLNAAYAYGGSDLLCQTLSENFGIAVDAWAEVDFAQFSEIIDTLGGVSMELRQDEADCINASIGSNLQAGTQTLAGQEALAYSRIRKLDADGDFSRTDRQRKMLFALMNAYKSAGLMDLLNVLNTLLPMVSTNLNTLSLLRYALEILPNLSGAQFVSHCIPAEGTYSCETIDGMAVLVADPDDLRATLDEYFPAQ